MLSVLSSVVAIVSSMTGGPEMLPVRTVGPVMPSAVAANLEATGWTIIHQSRSADGQVRVLGARNDDGWAIFHRFADCEGERCGAWYQLAELSPQFLGHDAAIDGGAGLTDGPLDARGDAAAALTPVTRSDAVRDHCDAACQRHQIETFATSTYDRTTLCTLAGDAGRQTEGSDALAPVGACGTGWVRTAGAQEDDGAVPMHHRQIAAIVAETEALAEMVTVGRTRALSITTFPLLLPSRDR
ncbi:hypothetical protein PB2503_01597 [Parvularcula bermudensis HTCC2503]|uniref:Uncharacterized protein n=1 Tax=Parvularcula bermudensis (strain ATCC BAA-594 / HTCC2503 / KCTC 12087) TaxID=314260 RepID=E0TBM3_PARBH|nr:hypothetical protein [Parvularcula bermudensis]ADM08398.1 hypothetical protein PB2503_01597 [Parvularcula bermudensis HTCC2503]